MEFKDTKYHLDKNNLNDLLDLIKSNLDINNIKHSKMEFSDNKKNVNENKYKLPINCKGSLYGTISITLKNEKQLRKIEEFRSDFELLTNRFLSNNFQESNSHSSQSLIGVSQYIINIEKFLNNARLNKKSILIEGHNASEQLTIASIIHLNSQFTKGELYELNCIKLSVYKDPLSYIDKLTEIKSGTLFINHIEVLKVDQQAKLITNLKRLNPNVRVITSSSESLIELINEGRFVDPLYQLISQLKLKLISLKDRTEDIPHILRSIIKKQGVNKKFSNESIELFKNYNWPNNYTELNQVASKLIRLSKNKTISLSDIENHAPFMLAGRKSVIEHQKLMDCLINKNFSCLEELHPSLKKSLLFISNNYEQEINLDRLADSSHISPSHLSFLFRSNFGISFKIIISKFRVEMIKKYFSKYPDKSITESALDNGFGDLSHFEKIFKKHTGLTPKKYKLQNLKI